MPPTPTPVVLAALLLATAAHAEPDAPKAADTPPDDATSTESVPVEVASKAQKELAVKQFKLGLDLYEAEKFDKALEIFAMSLSKVDSPNSRLMVARCLMRLERHAEAYRELERTVTQARLLARGSDKYGSTADAAAAELEQLKQKVAIVRLETDGVVTVGDTVVEGPARPPLVLAPGKVRFSLALGNGQRTEQELELAAGTEQTVTLKLPEPAPRVDPPPAPVRVAPPPSENTGVSRTTLGYVGLGAAGLGAAGFVVFGLLDAQQYEKLEDSCTGGRCPESLRSTAEDGRLYQGLANVSLGIGIVGVVTGTYFLLTSNDSAAASPALGSSDQSEGSARLLIGPTEITVQGRF